MKRKKITRARKVEIRPEGAGESLYSRKVRARRLFIGKGGTWPVWLLKRRSGEIKV